MTRRRRPVVAHALMACLVLDPALAAPATFAADNASPRRPVRAIETAAQLEDCNSALAEGQAPATSLSRRHLWPPNHALVDVGLTVDATPVCAGLVSMRVAVWADEADDAPAGDGVTIGDARFDVPDLFLRAERVGDGDGRVYLAITRAETASASGFTCETVVVAHSGSASALAAVNQQAQAARATCAASGSAPAGFFPLAQATFAQANQPPVVAAGADQGIAPGGVATLDATVTDDGLPNGTIELQWAAVAGPGEATFSDTGAEDTAVTFSASGTYTLRLTAHDGALQSHDDLVVVVGTANAAPHVEAGADGSIVLPATVAALAGSVSDDGVPNPALTVSWTVVSAPPGGTVSFSAPASPSTSATFDMAGDFVLRLTAHDGQLAASDDVTLTVHPEPPPMLTVSDRSVPEGHEGRGAGELEATLSKPWPRPVTVDFMTADGSATANCDYSLRYGTLTFEPGQTTASLLVPVMGELAPEGPETVVVHLGNAGDAILTSQHSLLTIVDDDAANQPPAAHTTRVPPDGATGIPFPPALSWVSTDPDAGDAVVHDLYMGTAASLDGQRWSRVCPASPGPGPSTAFGFDEARDRLIVVEQSADGVTTSRVSTLGNASGARGPSGWEAITIPGAPQLTSARAAYDPVTDGLIVVGRCATGCSALQTWVLENVSGPAPAWRRVEAGNPPPEVSGFALEWAFGRAYMFGGSNASGTRLDTLWRLDAAAGAASWTLIDGGGDRPSARDGATLVADDARDRLVLFGGRTGDTTASNEAWALSGAGTAAPVWHQLEISSGPSPTPRFGHTAFFEPALGRLLVFGGTTPGIAESTNFVFGDAWVLAGLSWTRLSVPAGVPAGRFDGAAAYSSSANRLIVAAGRNNKLPAPPADLWVLGDAMGSLPAVSLGQGAAAYAPGDLDPGRTYLWRVVTRDGHGSARGSAIWSFTGNRAPLVDAGPDRTVEISDGTALLASVSDDGLPWGEALSMLWSVVSGPGPVVFSNPQSPSGTAAFAAAGNYVLRFAVSDGALPGHDELAVAVELDNAPPSVNAGSDEVVALPQTTVVLAGSVADDGLPASGLLAVRWSQASGPSPGAFGNATQAATTFSFTHAGSYVLRLTATDGRETTTDEIVVAVAPANAAPQVTAGPDQAIVLPEDTVTLTGTVADDGRPSGTLTHAWAQLSGPPGVVFATPHSAMTTTTFPGLGSYRLRLSVSDGALSADDEIRIVVGSATVLPDLVVDHVDTGGVVIDPHTLATSGVVTVAVSNPGLGAAIPQFSVTFFEDRNGSGAFEAGGDAVLGVASTGPLGPGEISSATASVSMMASFAGNLVHAYVDSGGRIVEANEGNNVGSSAPACVYTPPVRAANPTVEWAWAGSNQIAAWNKVWGPPAVIDLDLDGTAEILFMTNRLNGFFDYATDGVIRGVDGRDGTEVLTTPGTVATYVNSLGPMAAGNIDADPYPEVIAVAASGFALLAFEHDGTFKWRSAPIDQPQWSSVVLADLDGDGVTEIVVGRQVLNADGTLRWRGTGGAGDLGLGSSATVVDLDLDGSPEVVAGNTAYRGSGPQLGQILWQRTSHTTGPVTDGFTAAANFDADPNPEIVLVSRAKVWMLEHDGAVKWGPVPIPGGNIWGGTPAVGNIDDDPALELVVSGESRLAALESDGSIAWSTPSVSKANAAVLFDLDGDGRSEVIVVDDLSFRIIGSGAILFESLTWGWATRGTAVVADVDGDGKVEIVVTDSGSRSLLPGSRVRIFGDASDTWVQSRPIWNQHDYHVSNVNDDGTIPAIETRALSSSRQNAAMRVAGGVVTPGCAYAKPDLTASYLRVAAGPTSVTLTVRIGNGGAGNAAHRVPVSFHDGDPRSGGQRLGIVRTSMVLRPGQHEDVALDVPVSTVTTRSVWVAVDDYGGTNGIVTESNEDNNLYDSRQALSVATGGADLAASGVDVTGAAVDPATLAVSGPVTATIVNQGDAAVSTPFEVFFFEDVDGDRTYTSADLLLGQATHAGGLAPREEVVLPATVAGVVRFAGGVIHAIADGAAAIAETDETNNVAWSGAACRVRPPVGVFTPAVERRWTASPVDPGSANVASTPVVVDLDGDKVADVVFVTFATAPAAEGRLRALSGRTGAELFTVTDPALALLAAAGIAAGDIDADGRPEILAIDRQWRVVAFEDDGTLKWRSPQMMSPDFSALAIADLAADGLPEIVLGRQVLRPEDGTLAWTAACCSRGGNPHGTYATVADLDLDGYPEVLVGNAAFDRNGAQVWRNTDLLDGLTAVGNFDDDPNPEIVFVSGGWVRLLDHTGAVVWGPVTIPGNFAGGPPVVADFDGDGRPEIGVGSYSTYTVIETAGTVRWSVPVTRPASPGAAIPVGSAFDFDGDGAYEVVYFDETGVKVRRGSDGALLADHAVRSCLLGPNAPVIADADGDGNAEIVVGASNNCNAALSKGIAVIGDASDRWVTARPVWNQFDFTATNVRDDGSVPTRATPSWLAGNTFRANAFGPGSPFRAPDLTASYVRRSEDVADLVFTVRIGNGGDGTAGPGIPISLYNGDPRLGFGRLLTVATMGHLAPGAFEDVVFRVPSTTAGDDGLFIGVDREDGTTGVVSECDEDNLVATPFFLNRAPVITAGPDVVIVRPQETAVLAATVTDDGLPLGSAVSVQWQYIGGSLPPHLPPPIADPTAATTTVHLAGPGVFLFRLNATDSARWASHLMWVTVLPANEAPVVNAGSDRIVSHPADSTLLAGTVSDDGLPSGALTYQWTVVGPSPGAVTFTAPASLSTTAHFTANGSYRLSLTASDGVLAGVDEVVVLVDPANVAPVVGAGPDLVLAGRAAQLAGSATDDGLPRGETLSYTWSLVEGAGTVAWADVHALDSAVEFSADGLYLLRLTATDGALFAHDDVVFRVNPVNAPPIVDAGADLVLTADRTVLAASVTDDGLPVGGALTSAWSKVSGPGSAVFASGSPTTEVVFSADGDYVLRLAAGDSVLESSDTVAVSVAAGNHAPLVNAGSDQTLAVGTFVTTVIGDVADDGVPGGPILSAWSKVSGPGAATFATPHAVQSGVSFDAPGPYTLRLTATDSDLAGRDDLAIVVPAAPQSGPAPSATLTTPVEGISITAPTMVRGTVTSGTLAGWRLEHRPAAGGAWTIFGSGTAAVSDGDLAALDTTLLLNGLYEIRLTATDRAGRSAVDRRHVVVRDNFKVGHFTVSFADLEVPLAGLPIQVGRTYDSRDKRAGDFGPGWRLDISNVRVEENGIAGVGWIGTRSEGNFPVYCLQTPSAKVVTVTLPNGLVLEFDAVITPSCRSFVPPDDVAFSYRARAGTQGTLSPIGGNIATVPGGWPEAGGSAVMQLFRVTDYTLFDPAAYQLTLPDGRSFVISQAEGLQRITDLGGNLLTVGRNGITHSSGRGVSFVRNGAGAITSVVDPMGHATGYGYALTGDLESVTDREGHTTHFRYHPLIAHHLESIKDPLGRIPLRNEYDENGRLQRHIDALGKVIEYTHSIGTRQEIVRDRNGKQRVLEYDARGNVVREIDPTGKAVVRTFDARNNRVTETAPHVPGAPAPPMTAYEYDAEDNVTKVTDAESHRTEYTYDARRQVRTTKDPLGRVTENTYDAASGNLLTSKDALGQITSYTYDTRGNVETQTVLVGGVPHVTRYAYDAYGNLVRETDALGHETSFTHDANGNRLTQTTTRGIYACSAAGCTRTSVETLTTTYVYDFAGRLLETRNPDGTMTRTVYDEMGRQKETYDALGHRTAYTYDEMGRPTRTLFADSTSEESTYDNEGRRLTSKDREGRVTSYLYDDVGRLVRTTYPDTTFTESVYDDAGRLVTSRDARGKATTYGYDRAGRRVRVRDPLLNETLFGYDANGNQTSVRDALLGTTSYEYDNLNRRTKTIFADLSFTSTGYDALGRRRSETDQAGKATTFEYDKVGRLVLVRDAAAKETKYTYDELGNRIAQRDANGRVTWFEYDRMGRETARSLPDGARESKSYDLAGNLHQRTDFMGRVTSYGYDVMNRLLSRVYPEPAQNVSFTYNPSGRRWTVTDPRGVTTYVYDVRQRLSSLTYPDGRRLEYGYDANGNRSSLAAVVGGQSLVSGFTHDDAGRLDVVTDPAGRAYDHGYDANGNRASLAYPNGAVTAYAYNPLNRLTNVTTSVPASGATIQSYGFTLGPAGNRTAITEADGTVRAYTYDALYRLTGERVTIGGPLQYEKVFTYDDVGNRLTQMTTGTGAPGTPLAPGSIAYDYDTRDRLLSETLGSNPPSTSSYDATGNLTAKVGEATYTWDFENRLTRVAKADGTLVDHAYDADGNRVQTRVTPATGPPVITEFLVDTSGSLSHVVAETSSTGALQAYYVRADDLLAVMRPLVPVPAPATPTDWQTRFVHADGIGSIRRLTDESAAITDGYTYTAFGELTAHTGTDPQPYAFAGEPYDPNSGFQYHRARWMDPTSGRFLGMDEFRGRSADPITLHKYLYGNANPADVIDPSGHEGLVSLQTGIGISNVIRSMATGFGVGTIIGAADAYLSGSDPDGIQAAAIAGGLLGSVTGGLFLVKFLQPVFLVAGNALAAVGVADALESDNYQLAGFRATLFLAGSVAYFRSIPEPKLPTGRLGNQATRDHIGDVVQVMRDRGWKLKAGGGALPEEYLPGPGPGTKGGNFIDITMEKNGRTLRINTVDTYADGVMPTRREAAAAALIRSKTGAGDHLLLIPKPK